MSPPPNEVLSERSGGTEKPREAAPVLHAVEQPPSPLEAREALSQDITQRQQDKQLSGLEQRLAMVTGMFTKKETPVVPEGENTEEASSLQDAYDGVKGWFSGGYASVMESVAKIPFIGGIMKSFTPENIMLSYYKTLASLYKSPAAQVATTAAAASTGFFGGLFAAFSGNIMRETILNPMGLSGQIGLLTMELQKAIAQYSQPGDIIAYDPNIDAADIDALIAARSQNPKLTTDVLVKAHIARKRSQTPGPQKFTINIEEDLLEGQIKTVDTQDTASAEKLSAIKSQLPNAKEVSLFKESDKPMVLDLQNKTASIASDSTMNLSTLNALLARGWENFRFVEILNNQAISASEARVTMNNNGFRVIQIQRNDTALQAIANGKLDNLVTGITTETKFALKENGSEFEPVPTPTPVTAAVPG